MEDLIKSGQITKKVREFGVELIKEGVKYIDVVEKVEAKIIELGGKPAFPADLSVNHLAAHDSPLVNDERVFKKGDLVKLDLGTHIKGCITDTAVTVEVGTVKYQNLIEASAKAL